VTQCKFKSIFPLSQIDSQSSDGSSNVSNFEKSRQRAAEISGVDSEFTQSLLRDGKAFEYFQLANAGKIERIQQNVRDKLLSRILRTGTERMRLQLESLERERLGKRKEVNAAIYMQSMIRMWHKRLQYRLKRHWCIKIRTIEVTGIKHMGSGSVLSFALGTAVL